MKKASVPDKTVNSLTSGDNAEKEEAPKDPTEDYVCLRDAEDGSMYYGEVGYQKKETGQVIKHNTPTYNEQIKPLTEE